MKIDMYNGDHATDADKIRIFFNDSTCKGLVYKNNNIIGDFTAKDSMEINLYFPQFTINYD
jgi:hypothetical protein